jgi:hypothetical protein
MVNYVRVIPILLAIIAVCAAAPEEDLQSQWNDFLHYTKIGRLDLAKDYVQAILRSEPEPTEILSLAQANPPGYHLLQRVMEKAEDPELVKLTGAVLDLIERGRFLRRKDPGIIVEEIRRLSSTSRGRMVAIERLKNAGQYAVPHMLKAMSDPDRKEELPNIIWALRRLERPAVRPLVASLQMSNASVKAEAIKALGRIKYPEALPYLKREVEEAKSGALARLAEESITNIDPAALQLPATELFFNLGEDYYYHAESLEPAEDADFANVWFWNEDSGGLTAERVEKAFFAELMAMRCAEWAMKTDPANAQAIGLWLAAFFRAESTGLSMPGYFGPGHADAATYAYTAGPEYDHQVLARALKDGEANVALGALEALVKNAGEKSIFYRLGTEQPLMEALSFDHKAVRYSAAIAVARAGPKQDFPQSGLVVRNLAEAVAEACGEPEGAASEYGERAARAMLELAQSRNAIIDLTAAREVLVGATREARGPIGTLAAGIMAYLPSPDAQRAIASMALDEDAALDMRISAFQSLAVSAKVNANLLEDEQVSRLYDLVASRQAEPGLRAAAAAAYGSLNLPSRKVKDLILDQSGI